MFADIIPARRMPLRFDILTYKVDGIFSQSIQPGQLVIIPFRSKQITGVVRRVFTNSQHSLPYNLKNITSITNISPALSSEQLIFLEELSTLYRVSLGFLVKGILFPLQKKYVRLFNEEKIIDRNQTSTTYSTHTLIHQTEKQLYTYVKKISSPHKQQLYILPDTISLEKFATNFKKITNLEPSIVTSDTTNQNLYNVWKQIWREELITVIGTRRAFFLPWKNLHDIFIIDEGDPLHKNWDMAPRFHNKDIVQSIARMCGSAMHMTGHSPTIDTYSAIRKKDNLNISSLINDKEVSIIDMHEDRKMHDTNLLSKEAKEKIETIDNCGTQSIFIFCHHRGKSSYNACKQCGEINQCNYCFVPFTYHQKKQLLVCHSCKRTEQFSGACKRCGSFDVYILMNGTEAIEEEIQKISLKNITSIRIDSDTEFATFPKDTPLIIIGTEQAWKKIDWSTISLVVYTDPDTLLNIPEYKTSEQIWYHMRDACFRLSPHTTFLIQTNEPKLPLYTTLFNPKEYYENEFTYRKLFNYPPFSTIIKIYTHSSTSATVEQEACRVYNDLSILTKRLQHPILIYPPRSTFPEYKQRHYWRVIVLKIPTNQYKQTFKAILPTIPSTWKIDINPQTILRF